MYDKKANLTSYHVELQKNNNQNWLYKIDQIESILLNKNNYSMARAVNEPNWTELLSVDVSTR